MFKTVFGTYNFRRLANHFGIPDDKRTNPLTAAEWWLSNYRDRRWRSLIYYLDQIEETGLADELLPYSEPLSGTLGLLITDS